jgi:hypothetical protein
MVEQPMPVPTYEDVVEALRAMVEDDDSPERNEFARDVLAKAKALFEYWRLYEHDYEKMEQFVEGD